MTITSLELKNPTYEALFANFLFCCFWTFRLFTGYVHFYFQQYYTRFTQQLCQQHINQQEFNHLVAANSTQLRGFAFNYTKNWDDAEDLIQDTLYKALRYKDYFQEGTNFKGWLFTIMRNIFINGYKRKRLQQNLLEESAHNVMINGGKLKEDTISSTLNHQEILKAVNTLNDDYRKPFLS